MKKPEGKKLHAKFSASGSDRWLNCPGSVALSAKAPPQVESTYAAEGTEAHECLEMIMKNKTQGRAAMTAMLKARFAPDMIRHGYDTYGEILKIWNPMQGAELICETKVGLEFVDEGMFGTVDAGIIDLFGPLWVIDYKYGAGRMVDPKENTQMIYYALGLAHKHHFNFEKVVLAIAQPRIVHRDGFFRTWDMEVSELKKWTGIFQKGVEACKSPKAPLLPGRWCFFCPAQSICPAIENRALSEAQTDFDTDYKR